jgi:hypothetical protein
MLLSLHLRWATLFECGPNRVGANYLLGVEEARCELNVVQETRRSSLSRRSVNYSPFVVRQKERNLLISEVFANSLNYRAGGPAQPAGVVKVGVIGDSEAVRAKTIEG